jgi:hypothetical protein
MTNDWWREAVFYMSGRPQRLGFDLTSDAVVMLFSSHPRSHRLEDPQDLPIQPYEVHIGALD